MTPGESGVASQSFGMERGVRSANGDEHGARGAERGAQQRLATQCLLAQVCRLHHRFSNFGRVSRCCSQLVSLSRQSPSSSRFQAKEPRSSFQAVFDGRLPSARLRSEIGTDGRGPSVFGDACCSELVFGLPRVVNRCWLSEPLFPQPSRGPVDRVQHG